jgi:hypothetical protein
MKTKLRKEGRGASILFMSIVLMFILLLLGSTLFQVIPAEMQAANRSHQDLNGHYVARSGVEEARSWLSLQMETFEDTQSEEDLPDYTEDDGASYDNIAAFVNEVNARRPFTKGDWRYEVDIRPQQTNVSQTNNFQPRYFAVRSTSFLNDRPIRRIDVLLRQSTFASFAFYTEQFDASTAFIMNGKTQMFGPVHTNDFFRFNATALESKGWTGVEPYFADVVTHSSMDPNAPVQGDGNAWIGGAPYDSGGPIDGRYEAVFKDGRNDLRLKNAIELPATTEGLVGLTWPDSATLPNTVGAFVHTNASGKADGGIYVQGDAQEVNLRLDRFGNQATVVRQNFNAGTNTTTTTKTKNIPFSPPKFHSCNVNPCLKWSTPGGGGGSGGGGGVGGGAAAGPNPTCLQWTQGTCQSMQTVPDGTQTTTSTDWDAVETTIFEVTENPVTVTNELGANVTADIGDTLVVTRIRNDEVSGNYVTTKVQRIQDSQINGNIFVNGNIGSEDHRAWERPINQTQVEARGLWGISKGSAIVDAAGNFVLDASGNKTYANKAVITPLDKGVSLGGDLLQFDPTRFAAEKAAGTNFANRTTGGATGPFNWTKVALDPNRMTAGEPDPEKSPDADHVLGVLTLDLWMKGSNTAPTAGLSNFDREMMGGDRFSDVYVVALAGRSESDGTSSGGFGTRRPHRDNLNDGLGRYRLMGGVIQGTVGRNRNDNSHGGQDTHHWVDSSGSVGYDVQMFYDKEATRQRIFPVQSAFGVVRMIESSRRDRS